MTETKWLSEDELNRKLALLAECELASYGDNVLIPEIRALIAAERERNRELVTVLEMVRSELLLYAPRSLETIIDRVAVALARNGGKP